MDLKKKSLESPEVLAIVAASKTNHFSLQPCLLCACNRSPCLLISPQLWLSSFSRLLPSKIKDFWSDILMLKWLLHFPNPFSFSHSSFSLLFFSPPFVPQSLLSNSYSPQSVISTLILYLSVRTIYPKPCADVYQVWFYFIRSSEERKISFHRSRKG